MTMNALSHTDLTFHYFQSYSRDNPSFGNNIFSFIGELYDSLQCPWMIINIAMNTFLSTYSIFTLWHELIICSTVKGWNFNIPFFRYGVRTLSLYLCVTSNFNTPLRYCWTATHHVVECIVIKSTNSPRLCRDNFVSTTNPFVGW